MRNAICLLFAALAGLGATTAPAAPPLINDTAATICYDASGSGQAIACTGSRQDGAYGRDVTAPNASNGVAGFRFARICNNGQEAGVGSCPSLPVLGTGATQWGCTLDKVSGLTWEIKTTDGSNRDMSKLFGATDFPLIPVDGADTFAASVNASGLCGAGDWRLPSYMELATLSRYDVVASAVKIDTAFFPHTPLDSIANRTSTPYTFDGTYRRTIRFGTGLEGYALAFEKRYVRLVRGAPLSAVQRFTPISSGTGLKDALTGLVWRRCAEGAVWDGSACVGTPTVVNWAGALQLAALAGGDWRLPNIAELTTLLWDDADVPCTFLSEPFPVLAPFWSNTPTANGTSAWVLDHQLNECVPRLKQPMTASGQVRLVRPY
jgi:Protein of unknown function (DUF1566)